MGAFWEILNIYDGVWGEKCALKRQRKLWWFLDLFHIRRVFFCFVGGNTRTVEHEMGATECHT